MNRLFRDRTGDDICPHHGPLRGQIKCRFCSYSILPMSDGAHRLPRALTPLGVGAFLIPLNVAHDQFQECADMNESV